MLYSSAMSDIVSDDQAVGGPLVILCPLRSFSSVVCAMLGQHPQLYGLPEVNLFIGETVEDVLRAHQPRPHGLHGLLRALAQLREGVQNEDTIELARDWLQRRRDWSTAMVFAHLAELAHPRRLVDKSPRTVMRSDYMTRVLDIAPETNFLHLTRHPRSTGVSILALLARSQEWDGMIDARFVDPEQIWTNAHGRIMEFTSTLYEGQSMRLKGEALLSDPDLYLPQIAEWLGLRTDAEAIAAMKHPEASPYACYGPENARFGNDPNFLEKPELREGIVHEPSLEGPVDWNPALSFQSRTLKLAKMFGYL
jgi:hypothetical protein